MKSFAILLHHRFLASQNDQSWYLVVTDIEPKPMCVSAVSFDQIGNCKLIVNVLLVKILNANDTKVVSSDFVLTGSFCLDNL